MHQGHCCSSTCLCGQSAIITQKRQLKAHSSTSSQQNNCKSAASARCISLLNHTPRKTPFSYLRAETWKADLPSGISISLQPAVNIMHTNQVSDGEVLHMHVGKKQGRNKLTQVYH